MKILTVSKLTYREALLKRLRENANEPKKAFGGKNAPAKNPIYIDEAKMLIVPEKVKTLTLETIYTIRKEIVGSNPNSKQIVPDESGIKKVIDFGIREILEKRLKEYGNDPKKAFSSLDENPIWLNKEKNISVKRVTILGISNAEALHSKKDKSGNLILDKNGKEQPVDFVRLGNNHHVAVYRDNEGNLQETHSIVLRSRGTQKYRTAYY